MVDDVNPTSQFHPYQPQTAIPHSDLAPSGLSGLLKRFGMDPSMIDSVRNSISSSDVKGQLGKVRTMARNNSGLVLGGLAAAAIGAGLLRARSMRTR